MEIVRIGATALLVGLAVAPGDQSSPVNRPWPPAVQTVAPDSPPLAPAEALKTFSMPPGYRLELVASEPMIQDPVAIDWDRDGRLVGRRDARLHARHRRPRANYDPTGRIVVLEDKNDDGAWTRAPCLPRIDLAAGAEGARPRRARRRAAERLAAEGHERDLRVDGRNW